MTHKTMTGARVLILLLALLLVFPSCAVKGENMLPAPDDESLMETLPGEWIMDAEVTGEKEPSTDPLAVMTFSRDGTVSLRCNRADGQYACTFEGTWSFESVPEQDDLLTLRFHATDDPAYAESGYSAELVYDVYSESWIEKDTLYIYLLMQELKSSSLSPFMDLYGYETLALHRDRAPNMRVVDCESFVSLRKKPSSASARLVRVPLNALVLAFEEYGVENGFLYCEYHDQFGYILKQYLQPLIK